MLAEPGALIERHLRRRGTGEFTLPGLLKITVAEKPASRAVKVQPLRGLRRMAERDGGAVAPCRWKWRRDGSGDSDPPGCAGVLVNPLSF